MTEKEYRSHFVGNRTELLGKIEQSARELLLNTEIDEFEAKERIYFLTETLFDIMDDMCKEYRTNFLRKLLPYAIEVRK